VVGPIQAAPSTDNSAAGWPPDLALYHGDEERGTRCFGAVVSLLYGGQTLRYRSASPDVALEVAGPRLAFVVDDATPCAAEILCEIGPVECSSSPLLFQAGTSWAARAPDALHEEICYGPDRSGGRGPWARLRHDNHLSCFEFRLAPRERNDVFQVGFPTDEYIVARRLARSNGLVLHASSLLQDGLAYLFLGHSGAGKSTTAMNAVTVGAEVLSDDRTIVVMEPDGTARAWGTPWHGSFRRATNASAPIAGIFVIAQDSAERLTPIGPARAIGEAFVRLIHPTPHAWEVELTLDTLERLVAAAPIAELRQRPTAAGYLEARRFAEAARR